MEKLGFILIVVYTLFLLYITVFCLLQLFLLRSYRKQKKEKSLLTPFSLNDERLPIVTVQLPIFNELYVVDRLLDNITQLQYPRSKFEIQVLDDSTDETIEHAKAKVQHYKELGFDIHYIHRSDRAGFKAGALKEGMKIAKGEFIAIFDADFLPESDFLLKALPYFSSDNIAVVQTRWGHINEDFSLLTQLQAFQLNVHFTVEQAGRCAAGHFLQFNGTAGIWRKKAIDDAGGWQADTLTEDLDLSYRAQLKGWKINYIEDITCSAELPAEIYGLKSQQFRWMKGGAENSRKLLPTILKSDLPFKTKFHSFMHLMASGIFLIIFLVAIASVPVLYAMDYFNLKATFLGFCLLGTLAVLSVFYEANIMTCWKEKKTEYPLLKFVMLFPIFMGLSMGMSLHNSIAVIQGYRGKKSSFIRTPKFNLLNIKDRLHDNNYLIHKIEWTSWLEALICLYFVFAIYLGFKLEYYSFILFHALLMFGFGINFYYALRHLNFK
ncbi:MAG TPA: glycosyltransferase family 2 protein [Saprospiraceae bacterium]|nr:glycosyltransferase family 2 protein [Saprospiraceae bacterium]